MATTPYFILSPNTVLSIIGLAHGPDKTLPNPAEDWREATVDVVIPAFNEESNIPLCLAALARQTRKPTRIILIDDGSRDRTVEYARTFCALNGMDLIAIQRARSIGKTPTLKRQSREFDSDVEFILDGDTVLESENYIDRVVEELYKGAGIASACGTVLPLRDRDRRAMLDTDALKTFLDAHPEATIYPKVGWFHHLQRGITDMYRDVLYFFLQKFVYLGQMTFFGSILNPVGCAVAYRRSVLKTIVFDRYEPILGDDLTNSEDIFIGFAMNDNGYRNIQVTDIYARSQEPEVGRVPGQIYLWSSSFLQSCYYFDELMRSPFKAFKRYRRKKKEAAELAAGLAGKRIHPEQYRQPFGADYTLKIWPSDRLGAVHVGIRKSGLSDHAVDHDPAAVVGAAGDHAGCGNRGRHRHPGHGGQGPPTGIFFQGPAGDAIALCRTVVRTRHDRPLCRRPVDLP